MCGLPTLGLEVVDMDMLALGDRRDDAADVLSVLGHRVADREVDERHLVADRHIMAGGEAEIGIVLGHDAEHVGAGLEAFDHDHADVVLAIVHEQLGNAHGIDSWGSLADCKSYIRY